MQLDTSLSLELVITILAILGAVWRLDHRVDKKLSDQHSDSKDQISELKDQITNLQADFAELRKEVKADFAELRKEVKADIAELRKEVKADFAELRKEVKADIAELRKEVKADIATSRRESQAENVRLGEKIDNCTQRVARLEGIILAREDLVGTIAETPQQ